MKTKKRAFAKNARKLNRFHTDREIEVLQKKYEALPQPDDVKYFTDFPLSAKTLNGLRDAKFKQPTEIQRQAIGPSLQGKDVLGAAQTGSGKTLAFLIPLLEHLFMQKWSRMDGVGGIIISPTRELAYQIFETLKKIGQYHDFSAGLIIGGKNLKFERKRMDQINILICTPGRLLQHMDENPLFNATTMQVLVLDEADRCLDMGFAQTIDAILENLPVERQTLLYSATQTSSIKDLARLNLSEPVYIGQPADGQQLVIPALLQQTYTVVALEDKITMLWSFIRHHQHHKCIVFLTSCKQVKYVYEIFCKLRPGISLLALYGTLHQERRIAIYDEFMRRSHVVLFATDVASRGLDFPSVNWVVQLDCPEDVTQYVHRAGRSARNQTRGESLLVLLPNEEETMLAELQQKSIEVRRISVDPKKLFSPRAKIEAYLAQLPELKASAQRAFVAYIKSIFLMRNKRLFNAAQLDLDAYAKSLGLAVTPRVRFLERFLQKQKAQQSGQPQDTASDENSEDAEPAATVTKSGRKEKTPSGFNMGASDSESEGDDLFTVKRVNHDFQGGDDLAVDADDADGEAPLPAIPKKEKKLVTKTSLAKKAMKKKLQLNEKVRFDADGNEIVDTRKQLQSKLARELDVEADAGGIDLAAARSLLSEEDKYDKQRFRDLVKQRRKEKKEKLKRQAAEEDGNGEEAEQEEDHEDGAEMDDFGDDGDDDDDENSVDLTWLPDPNKIYNQKNGGGMEREETADSDGDQIEEDDDDEVDAEPVRKKPKVTSKLTLDDAEIIAAQLLANS